MNPPPLLLSAIPPWVLALRAVQWALGGLIVVAAGLSAWSWMESVVIEEQAARYEQAAGRLQAQTQRLIAEAKQSGLDLSERKLSDIAREVTFANQLLEKRAFSWTRFLNDLENAVPPRISINSVALNFKDSSITLNGAARTFKDLTEFAGSLERHAAFQNVALSNHRIKQAEHGQGREGADSSPSNAQSVEFTLSVTYQPEP